LPADAATPNLRAACATKHLETNWPDIASGESFSVQLDVICDLGRAVTLPIARIWI
jgi:hypothetical protein